MTKMSPINGNETKLNIFPQNIFKSDIMSGHYILYFDIITLWHYDIISGHSIYYK